MAKVKTIMFDLDGTLIDSVPDLAWAVDRTCVDRGLPPRGEARVRNWVGNGVRMLIRRAIADTVSPGPEPDELDQAIAQFNTHYATRCCVDTVLYPTVIETLTCLKNDGFKLAVVTNKTGRFTHPTLEHFDLIPFFDRVLSYDSLPLAKPDPLPLTTVMDELGRPGLLIGDSATDVKAARAAGIPVICMSYGYNHGEPISQLNPDAVIDLLSDCLPLITRLSE